MGQPSQVSWLARAECIGARQVTGGSETSQYPEEKTSNEIPLVVASERGSGQTELLREVGVVGRQCGLGRLVERS
jgi:hypothetical protein